MDDPIPSTSSFDVYLPWLTLTPGITRHSGQMVWLNEVIGCYMTGVGGRLQPEAILSIPGVPR